MYLQLGESSWLRTPASLPTTGNEFTLAVPLSAPLPSARGGLHQKQQQTDKRFQMKMLLPLFIAGTDFSFLNTKCVNPILACNFKKNKIKKMAQLRESGDGAEVVVDVEHGRVQEGVDVLETLEPGLESPPSLCLHLPQLLLGQLIQRGGRGRHR